MHVHSGVGVPEPPPLFRPVRGIAASWSGMLFVASCGAIKGPSADNRLCLKGTHSLVPVLPCLTVFVYGCVYESTMHFHAPILIYYKGIHRKRTLTHAATSKFYFKG